MHDGAIAPMIWVLLNQNLPTGTHEFADSVNDGPWGEALTRELIPELERTYRMDARASGRFLTGHSSGGWAGLWLQTHYPHMFGGVWSTAPDPVDFHDWLGVDLYARNANVYHHADGSPVPMARDQDKAIMTLEQFATLEAVLGLTGGQTASFDWVFSPRGPTGSPLPMFDMTTGAVDPAVVSYWRDHWDIAAWIEGHWSTLKPDLNGKLHLIVGTADTFYLDGSVHRLQHVLNQLGARSSFRYLPGRTHFDLYEIDGDDQGLTKTIANEMYAIARPNIHRPGRSAPGGPSAAPK